MQIIAASPGTYVIGYIKENDTIWKDPVLAWRYDSYMQVVYPVTMLTHDKIEEEGFVLFPDGIVVDIKSDGSWNLFEDWKATQRETNGGGVKTETTIEKANREAAE
jgi:hypothetical protein